MPAPTADSSLDEALSAQKGIGPARAAALAAAGIATVRDLALHLPARYQVRVPAAAIRDLVPDAEMAVAGTVVAFALRRRGKQSVARVVLDDGTGRVEVLFFNQPHIGSMLPRGARAFVQGRTVARGGVLRLAATFHERADGGAASASSSRIPVYDLPDAVPPRLWRRLAAELVPRAANALPDWRASADFGLEPLALLPLGRAVAAAHLPASDAELEQARRRLAYEELIRLLLPLEQRKALRAAYSKPRAIALGAEAIAALLARLPFEPTRAQRRAFGEIGADLAGPSPMHRLLHGDVGSGKTAVALLALAAAVRAGHQGALLVPTEVLAAQHEATAVALLAPLGVEVERLSRSTAPAAARAARERLAAGRPAAVIGTHALLAERVLLPALALAVIDEQHRFGVAERARLVDKAAGVDLLVMTATPIPRSLALTIYGDLELSVLDELPPGRRPIATRRVVQSDLRAVVDEVRAEVAAGGRAFFVCPLVAGSEADDIASAESFARRLAKYCGGRPEVALAHGRRSPADNASALAAFRTGARPILVATVLVEVGVDVPEATAMVILAAERFGLAQLHQLRGRVGRGARAGRCILVQRTAGAAAAERLEVLARESDGFRIAEADLAERGPGEVLGRRQHGALDFRFSDLARDFDLLALAKRDARALFAAGRAAEVEAALAPLFPPVALGLPGPG